MPQAAAFFSNPMNALSFLEKLVSFIQQIVDMFKGANSNYEATGDANKYMEDLEQVLPKLNEKLAGTGIELVAPDRLDSEVEVRELQDILRNILANAEEYKVSPELRAELERTIKNLEEVAVKLHGEGKINDVNGDGRAVILNRLPANLQPVPGGIDYH
jgi:hypothetical protein